ncbi:hypothetical protein GF367_00465 [Candidatus Woesearchaeota archaeon]|nr:hypothetical protein [Candidatus Woesearchaeota archaeon]
MINASITFPDKTRTAAKVFAPEEKRLLNGRASYDVTEDQDGVTITAQAQDATAMRAVLNSVCKTLIIYEKANKVVHYE